MKCGDLEELLSAYADRELAQTQREFVEEHLAVCAHCRVRLARYQQAGKQLVSLRTTSPVVDIKEATMSRIKSETVFGKSRRWLRPAIAGVSAALVLLVLTAILVLPGREPDDVLARALANTENLRSLRVHDFAEVRSPETNGWFTNYVKDVDYAASGGIHTKGRFTTGTSDNVGWQETQFIISDNVVYLWRSTPPLVYSAESIGNGWGGLLESLQQPSASLRLLADIKKMPDEEIDGIPCFHYRSLADVDSWVEQQLADAKERARMRNSSWTEERAKQLEALWRTRQVELEYWVGKTDNIIHQWRMTDTHTPEAETETLAGKQSIAMRDGRETIRYYNFNEDIVVKPPLDNQGNILPEWRLQEEK